MCLVKNKSDLEDDKVPKDEVLEFCREKDLLFIEASAKTGDNINVQYPFSMLTFRKFLRK